MPDLSGAVPSAFVAAPRPPAPPDPDPLDPAVDGVVVGRLRRLFDPAALAGPHAPVGSGSAPARPPRSSAPQRSGPPATRTRPTYPAFIRGADESYDVEPVPSAGQRLPGDDAEPVPLAHRRLPGPEAFDPGRRGIRAIAAVVVVVAVGAGLWAWSARPDPEPVSASTAPAAAPTSAGPTAPATEIVVAVAGRVRRPGLVRLPAGARVADAVEAAGGLLPGVDTVALNLARRVADGELILVGVTAPPVPPGAPDTQPNAAGAASPGGKVNLNTATLGQLDGLPGVGPVLAQRILDYRDQHGGFRAVTDLRQVDGIGDARYEELKDLVTV